MEFIITHPEMSVQADDALILFQQNFPLSVISVVIYIFKPWIIHLVDNLILLSACHCKGVTG
jgi:hypothetical protein